MLLIFYLLFRIGLIENDLLFVSTAGWLRSIVAAPK